MAVPKLFQPINVIHTLFSLIIILLEIPQFFSQPQNIQTFYPFPLPPLEPPRVPTSRRPVHPSLLPPSPPPPPPPSRKKKAIRIAIGVTAPGILVLSGILFLLFRYSMERSSPTAAAGISPYADPYPEKSRPGDELMMFGGMKIEGVIVDEEGLDVLYWRNLENGDHKGSFKRQVISNNSRKRSETPPTQEIPLLRGQSSSSHHPTWADSQNKALLRPPTFETVVLDESVDKQDSVSQPELNSPPLTDHEFSKASFREIPPPSAPSLPPKGMTLSEGTLGDGEEEVKMEALHCDELIHIADHSMTGDKMESGSFTFNGGPLDALFGYVATNKKSTKEESSSQNNIGDNKATGPTPPIFILGTKKSENIAIILKSLGVTRREIIDALNKGEGLNTETLEKLCRIAPTREEESEILNYAGNPTRLADSESFLFHILKSIPSAFSRFNAMLFRSNFGPQIHQLNQSLLTLEQACNELRGQTLFMKLLEAVLKAGNRMNAGTSKGDAQAFNLTALRKLSDVKSIDGKTTLLQFVVQEVVRAEGKRCLSRTTTNNDNSPTNGIATSDDDKEKEYVMFGLPLVGGLSSQLTYVKKAAAIDYESISKTYLTLSSQASDIGKFLAQCSDGGRFATEMKRFLNDAKGEIKAARVEQIRVMELVERTTDYYQAGAFRSKTWQPLQLFVITRDFLGMVDCVCVEIAKNMQNKKPEGESSSLSVEPQSRAVRFPKLPANFLSQ